MDKLYTQAEVDGLLMVERSRVRAEALEIIRTHCNAHLAEEMDEVRADKLATMCIYIAREIIDSIKV